MRVPPAHLARLATLAAALVAIARLPSARAESEDSTDTNVKPTSGPVRLAIDISKPRGPWVMNVVNDTTVPVRLRVDARWLTLLVRAEGKKYIECALPPTMRDESEQQDIVIKAGAVHSETFDPRMFCFDPSWDSVGEGTSVTAFLGYKPEARRQKAGREQLPPFAVEPVRGDGEGLPIKRLVSSTQWLPKPVATVEPKPASDLEGSDRTESSDEKLILGVPRRVDAVMRGDVRLTVDLKNVGSSAAVVHIRPDDLEFSVADPAGAPVSCGYSSRRRGVARDLFHTIARNGKESMTVLLGEVCPSRLFRTSGIYEVRTALHIRQSGSRWGLRAVTGDFVGSDVTLVRVQRSMIR